MPSLTVEITAETGQLRNDMALAKQDYLEVMAAYKRSTKEMSDAGITATDAMKANFLELGMAASASEARVRATSAAFRDSFRADSVQAATESMSGLATMSNRARTEVIVLGHELLQGRFTRVPGSLMVMAESMGGVSTATIGAAAGVAALGFGLYELVTASTAAHDALVGVQAAASFRNLDIATGQFQGYIDQVKQMKEVTTQEAGQIVATFARMKGANAASIQAMVDGLAQWAAQSGEKVPEAARSMVAAMGNIAKGGHDLLTQMKASAVTVAQFDAAVRNGDQGTAATIFWQQYAAAIERVETVTRSATDEQRKLVEARARAASQGAGPGGSDAIAQHFDAELDDVSKRFAQKLTADVKAAASAAGGGGGSQEDALDIEDRVLAAQDKQVKAQTELNQLEALGTQSGEAEQRRLAAIAEIKNKMAEDEQRDINKELEAERQAAAEQKRLTDEGYRDKIAALEVTREAAQRGSAAEIAALRQEEAVAVQTYGARSVEALRVLKEIEAAELAHQGAMAALQREQTNVDIEIARIKLQAQKDELDAEVSAGEKTAAEKIATERGLLQQEYALDLEANQNEINGLQQGTLEFAKAMDQRKILAAKLNTDLAALDRQQAADAKKTALETEKDWMSALKPIQQGFDTTLSEMLRGHKTFAQAVQSGTQQLVTQEIEQNVKRLESWLITEIQKEMASLAADSAIEVAASQEGLAGLATQKASASSSIIVDAKQAASGAYASASQVPYVGWLLGPVAAAAAFAAVMAYDSFETGAMEIPSTGLAQLHQGEMVVPATFADSIRGGDLTLGGPGASAGGNNITVGVTMPVTAMDAAGVQRVVNQNIKMITRAVVAQLNANPSMRPSY